MSPRNLPSVRERLLKTLQLCSNETADLFCSLLLLPADALVASAVISLVKPYGTNHILVAEGNFGLSFASLRPGHGTSLHYHVQRRELFVVRAGDLHLVHGNTEEHLTTGDVGGSTPGTPHSLCNIGVVQLEVLEAFSPALLDDKVRITDPYARALGSVSLHQ